MSDTLARGRITTLALKFDKQGIPYLDARLQLSWTDDLDALMRQSSRTLAFTITSKDDAKQIPLFEAP